MVLTIEIALSTVKLVPTSETFPARLHERLARQQGPSSTVGSAQDWLAPQTIDRIPPNAVSREVAGCGLRTSTIATISARECWLESRNEPGLVPKISNAT